MAVKNVLSVHSQVFIRIDGIQSLIHRIRSKTSSRSLSALIHECASLQVKTLPEIARSGRYGTKAVHRPGHPASKGVWALHG